MIFSIVHVFINVNERRRETDRFAAPSVVVGRAVRGVWGGGLIGPAESSSSVSTW